MFRCQICFLFLFSSILDGDDLEMFRRVSKVVIVCVHTTNNELVGYFW